MSIVLSVSFFACSKSGDTIYVDDDHQEDNRPIVYFIYKEGAMGDLSYQDELWRGITKATDNGKMLLSLAVLPQDSVLCDNVLNCFFSYMLYDETDERSLVIISNDNIEPLIHRYEETITETDNVTVLLTETKDTTLHCHTMRLSGYGAYYQAGRVVAQNLTDVDSIFIATANPTDLNVSDMRTAFCRGIDDGEEEAGRQIGVDNYYMSKTSGGYDKADTAYQMSYGIDSTYQLVLPICGGTVQGFFRYNREHPASFYTIGVDADMQQYTARVPFSIVKHIDEAIADWITRWANGDSIEQHTDWGLSSDYIELVVSDRYRQQLGNAIDDLYQTAIEKEEEYENGNR